jgi:hypothetical protein
LDNKYIDLNAKSNTSVTSVIMNLTINTIKYIYKMILYVRKLSTACTLLKHTIHCHNRAAVEINRKCNGLFLEDTCFTWGYMSTNVLLFKVILNKVWADHFPSLLVVLNFNLWSDNNNNPEQCNVPDGLRSNDLSNRKQTLYQLCIVEGGYESSPVAIIYVVDEVYPYPLNLIDWRTLCIIIFCKWRHRYKEWKTSLFCYLFFGLYLWWINLN